MSISNQTLIDPALRAAFTSLTPEQQQAVRDGDPGAERDLKTAWMNVHAHNPFPNRATRRRQRKGR